MTNPIANWEMTLKYEVDWETIKHEIKSIAKKYTIQLEESEEGYKHYQGRLSLFKKKRKDEFVKLLQKTEYLKTMYISPTVSDNVLGEAFYCMKLDTRIDGVWTDKDKEIYIPRQIREITNMKPWQKQVIDSAEIWDTRNINVIYDTVGNIGKSVLTGYIRCHSIGRKIPPINDYKDIMRMVCDMPTAKLYLFDFPRALKQDKLGGLYTAIEEIKSGYAYDDRYQFKEKFFDCPQIWIFCNTLPDMEFLSKDRWIIWQVSKDDTLRRFAVTSEYHI